MFRPETPKLVMWGVALVPCVAFLAMVVWDAPDDSLWPLGMGVSACAAAICVRGLLVRVIVDDAGVETVNMFSRRRYRWNDILRFEISAWSAYAIVVTTQGKRHRLGNQQMSQAERFLQLSNHTEDVVESLNSMLQQRIGNRRGNGDQVDSPTDPAGWPSG